MSAVDRYLPEKYTGCTPGTWTLRRLLRSIFIEAECFGERTTVTIIPEERNEYKDLPEGKLTITKNDAAAAPNASLVADAKRNAALAALVPGLVASLQAAKEVMNGKVSTVRRGVTQKAMADWLVRATEVIAATEQ